MDLATWLDARDRDRAGRCSTSAASTSRRRSRSTRRSRCNGDLTRADAGAREPAQQRREVHARGRRASSSPRARTTTTPCVRVQRQRHRHRAAEHAEHIFDLFAQGERSARPRRGRARASGSRSCGARRDARRRLAARSEGAGRGQRVRGAAADDAEPMRRIGARFDVVTIVAAARGLPALRHILSQPPSSFPAPMCAWPKRAARPRADRAATRLRVHGPAGTPLEAGTVYLAPPHAGLVSRPDRTLVAHAGQHG